MDHVVGALQRYGASEPLAAFLEEDSRSCEERAPADPGSLAVMCVDGLGRPLFATARGWELCARWNAALQRREAALPALRLPNRIQALYAAARAPRGAANTPSPVRMPARWSLLNPVDPDLILTVELGQRQPGAGPGDCSLLWLDENPLPARLQSLSPSERRVAVLVAQGLRNHQIAEQLCRSRRTVEFQLNSIYRKLAVSSRAQLMRALL